MFFFWPRIHLALTLVHACQDDDAQPLADVNQGRLKRDGARRVAMGSGAQTATSEARVWFSIRHAYKT